MNDTPTSSETDFSKETSENTTSSDKDINTEESKAMGDNVLAHDRIDVNATNNQYLQPMMDSEKELISGGARYVDKTHKFTRVYEPEARLQVTGDQISEAKQEMNNSMQQKTAHQEALDSNTKANEGFTNMTTMSPGWKEYMKDEKESIDKTKAHQEALDSNTKANEGFTNMTTMSPGWKEYMKDEKESIDKIKAHQEALDSNTKANEGFTNMTTMSPGWKEYMESEEANKPEEVKEETEKTLAEKLAQIEKDIQDLRGGRNITELSEIDRALLTELIRQQNILLEQQKNEGKSEQGSTTLPEGTPPPLPVPEILDNKKKRDGKKIALIAAGVGVGAGTGALLGAPTALLVSIGAIATSGGLNLVDRYGRGRVNLLNEKLKNATTPEEVTKYNKRIEKWNKFFAFSKRAKEFLTGVQLGAAATTVISGAFFGGRGLLTPKPPVTGPIGRAPTGSGASNTQTAVETGSVPPVATTGTEYMYTVQSGDSMPRLVQEAARLAGKDPMVAERLLYQQPNLDATFRGMLGVNNPLGNVAGGAQGGIGTQVNLESIANYLKTAIP
ncbi:MAG: hypothetical protein PHE21_01845 [Candidatus Dojkabacteria bacterium]|nr:hypothetical protein [Candidatus Dojkabacteria bacterium]